MRKNVTYHNPIHQEENTPLVTVLETRIDTKQSTARDSRGAVYVIELSKASFGSTSYPEPGSQWYLKKISSVWTLMARAPRQNPQLNPDFNPQPGESYVGDGGTTVFVGDTKTNGDAQVVGGLTVNSDTQIDGNVQVDGLSTLNDDVHALGDIHVDGNAQIDGSLTFGNSGAFAMIGEIRMWPTVTAPSGWQLCDGTSLLRATYTSLFALLCPALGTVTMTIASPCVVSFTSHGLSIGDRVFFTTTGALPTGVSANTTYWVISSGFGVNSFQISTTQGGSAVNTSGSQSGVHTLSRTYFGIADSTHFNIPDYRGRTPVGRDSSQTEFAAVGMTGGEKTHTLTETELPNHFHGWLGAPTSGASGTTDTPMRGHGGSDANFRLSSELYASVTYASAQLTNGQAHNNLSPYLPINFIIKLL